MLSSTMAYVTFYVAAIGAIVFLCASVWSVFRQDYGAAPVYGVFAVMSLLFSWCVTVGAGL